MSLSEAAHFVLLYWSSYLVQFSYIMHIKVNKDHMFAILNFTELNFFRAYPPLKPHILFYSNGFAIWHSFSDITHFDNVSHFFTLSSRNFKWHILFYSDGLAI